MNRERYVGGGKIKREAIAMDVRYRRISHEELLEVISDPVISAGFFGDKYTKKIPRKEWDEQYLEKLSYAVVSESFNRDYLLYLEDVANTVSSSKGKSKMVVGGVVIVVAVAVIIGVIVSMS